jgi:hypothetical protein
VCAVTSLSCCGPAKRERLSQFTHGQGAKVARKRKAVRGARDDSAGGHARFANHVANKIEMDRIPEVWELGRFASNSSRGVGRHPQRSSLLGLGRARRTSCSSARHGVRGQEAGRRRMSMPVAACVLKISGAQPQPLHIGDKDAGPRNPLISPGMPSTCSGEENWSKKDQCG